MSGKAIIRSLLKGLMLVVAIGAVGAGTYYVYRVNFPDKKASAKSSEGQLASEETWEEQEAREAREDAAKAELLGLNTFYTWEWFTPNVHTVLFHDKDFKRLTEMLDRYRDNTSTPLERHRYSEVLRYLHYDLCHHGADTILETLNEWIGLAPGTYYPLIARANLRLGQAADIRDGRYLHQLSEAELTEMESLNQNAWDDLIAAKALGPKDPEVSADLLPAAAAVGKDLSVLRKFYDETLALSPHHLDVRLDMLHYLQPEWYGSHEEMRALVAESAGARAEFPYLFALERAADSLIERGMVWESEETMRKGAAAFEKQLALTPDDNTILGKAAWYTYKAGELTRAAELFERLGTIYPANSDFKNIYEFHAARIESFRSAAASPDVTGTPREKVLLDLALAAEPTNGPLSADYLRYLARTRNTEDIKSFFARVQDPYILTGTPGDMPELNELEALALANGLFWSTGVHGAEEELLVLEKALALAPENAFVQLLLGEHYSAREEFREARAFVERARELAPNYLPALHTLAWLSYHERNLDEGIAHARALLASGDSFYVKANTADANEIIALCEKRKAKKAKEAEAG